MRSAVTERNHIASMSLADQWHHLVLRPFSELKGAFACSPYLVVVDGLDECEGEREVRIILQLLAKVREVQAVRLRILVTSRLEALIEHSFHGIPEAERCDFVLHNIKEGLVNRDISIFLKHQLEAIGQEWTCGAAWPGELAIRRLVQKSSGSFIWAATACRFISAGVAQNRLTEVLEGTTSDSTLE